MGNGSVIEKIGSLTSIAVGLITIFTALAAIAGFLHSGQIIQWLGGIPASSVADQPVFTSVRIVPDECNSAVCTAHCDHDEKALGGGCIGINGAGNLQNSLPAAFSVRETKTFGELEKHISDNQWTCFFNNNSFKAFSAIAICGKLTTLKTISSK
jgi:hypothetical protein